MIQTSKIISKYILQLILSIFGIGLITASTFSIFLPKGDRLSEIWNQLQIFFWSFFFFKDLEVNQKDLIYVPFYKVLSEPYSYTFIILLSAFICSIIFALLLAYIAHMSPKIIKRMICSILFFLQSIPDVVFIVGLQILFFWIYKKTNIMIVDPVAGLEERIYLLPIFTVSVIPTIQLFQMIYLSIEEEKVQEYVEYAKAKGLSKSWVLGRHILRNVTITLLSNSKLIFWVIISNLLVVEYLFNMKGYFSFLFKNVHAPEIFFMSLVLLLIPFFIIEKILNVIVMKMKGGEIE